jgi:pimeloyl-ACP methyl ester carboxylesterase
MDEHMENWSRVICDAIRCNAHDEILLIGHSTGGALVVDLAARVAERCRREGISPAGFEIMTIGSTLLKIGLHPAARQFRQRAQALAQHREVGWYEYQSLTDIINFYKCDPFAMMGLRHDRPDEFPAIRQIRMRDMLRKDIYKRLKRSFFRVHYQFINANSKPYFYDFCMICFGGTSLPRRFNSNRLGFDIDRKPLRKGSAT